MISKTNIIFICFFRAENAYISVSSCKEQQMKEKLDLQIFFLWSCTLAFFTYPKQRLLIFIIMLSATNIILIGFFPAEIAYLFVLLVRNNI